MSRIRAHPSTLDDLTPPELQIARAVGEGPTNREVAAELFLSPRTIDLRRGSVRSHHLYTHRVAKKPACSAWPGTFATLAPMVRDYLRERIFTESVERDDKVILRRLAEADAQALVTNALRDAIRSLVPYARDGRHHPWHRRVMRGMYDPAAPLPIAYAPLKRGIYSDYIRVERSWNRQAVVAREDYVETMLNHSLIPKREPPRAVHPLRCLRSYGRRNPFALFAAAGLRPDAGGGARPGLENQLGQLGTARVDVYLIPRLVHAESLIVEQLAPLRRASKHATSRSGWTNVARKTGVGADAQPPPNTRSSDDQ